jgi:hypothetical protein
MPPQHGRDLGSVSNPRHVDLLVVPARAIGINRIRTRAGSNVTTLPFSKASTSWGRFARNDRAGIRLPSPRNWMTDGCPDKRTASRGHEDSMLGGSAFEDHVVVGVLQSY